MPLRFAPKSLNRILASIHKDFEFSTVEAASPQNPMRKGRLDNFHALHTNPPRWPPQRHELLPVCVPDATFRHISGPRKGTALTHEKCTRFRGPSRYINTYIYIYIIYISKCRVAWILSFLQWKWLEVFVCSDAGSKILPFVWRIFAITPCAWSSKGLGKPLAIFSFAVSHALA